MKKLFALAVIIAGLASPKAEAHPVHALCAISVAEPGVSIAFIGGMAAFATLPIAIIELQDEHVWSSLFPVVDESFPGDKHFPVPAKAASNGFGKPYHVTVDGVDTIRRDGF